MRNEMKAIRGPHITDRSLIRVAWAVDHGAFLFIHRKQIHCHSLDKLSFKIHIADTFIFSAAPHFKKPKQETRN